MIESLNIMLVWVKLPYLPHQFQEDSCFQDITNAIDHILNV